MTTVCYVIDASLFILLSRFNPHEFYPIVWKRIEKLITDHRMIAPKEVFKEITFENDDLAKWAKLQENLFIEPYPEQISSVRDVLEKFPSIIDTKSRFSADPWIIALALEKTSGLQQTLTPIKWSIVTEEKSKGNKVRIPFVCKHYELNVLTIFEMFRIEGWVFD